MSRKNQIPFLVSRDLAGGRTTWYWTPSPKLRKLGYKRELLGDDFADACVRAIEINQGVAAGTTPATLSLTARRAAPITFGELVTHFRESEEWSAFKPSTQRQYSSSLGILSVWAYDGRTAVRSIDSDMVLDLRDKLVRDGRKHRTSTLLTVLRIVLAYAKRQRFIKTNPASEDLRIPEPPKRTARIIRDDMAWLEAAADELGYHHVRLAVTLGFYTMQREADLLDTTRFRLAPIRDISKEAQRVLAGSDGRVVGLTLIQNKTNVPVAIPLVPLARTAVETVLNGRRAEGATGTYLITDPRDEAGLNRCSDWRLQRDYREVKGRAVRRAAQDARAWNQVAVAAMVQQDYGKAERAFDKAHELLEAARRLRKSLYRDLRRSGMCWMRDLGVSVPMIASISGHSIEHTQKILDTYLPRDTRAAAEGMALAVSRQAERDAEDEADRAAESD